MKPERMIFEAAVAADRTMTLLLDIWENGKEGRHVSADKCRAVMDEGNRITERGLALLMRAEGVRVRTGKPQRKRKR